MAAAIPCIMVFVGMTITLRSESSAACCAAIDDVSDSRVGQVAVGKQLFVVDALLFFALL